MYNRTIFTNQCRLIHIVINSINLKIISNTPVINNINQGIAYHEKHVHYLESIESKLPLRLLSSLRNTSCRSCLPLALTHSTKSSEESISITYRDKKKTLSFEHLCLASLFIKKWSWHYQTFSRQCLKISDEREATSVNVDSNVI